MSNISALRLQHEHPSDLSGQMPDLTHGFTIEAWVRPAPMDGAVRLYPQPGYGGAPVRLKEGLYRRMAADHLPQLGSACLPEDMEAVFFSEPDFQGDALAVRQDLPQAPDSHQQIGSVVVLDHSHRRQNHVVLFAQAGYQGQAEALVLPDFWQRPDANDAEQQAADQKPGLAQVGSAWVPPGAALEVTQLRTSAVAGSSAITIENWTCASPVRTVFIQSADGSVEARAVLNSTSSLPVEWGFNVQAGQPAAIPENNILFLFEKAGYEGKETIMAGKHLGQPSLPTPIGSAIYVAVAGAAGVIGIGPKSQYSGEPPIRFFATGDPLPADAINWHFWVPPDFCLVPGRDETIPDRIGSGLQTCPGGASYIVKRTAGTQPPKEMSRLAAGMQRVARPPDQPKTREGQGIYRLADGRWATFAGPGQRWLQDVPDIAVVNVPKQRALFLFRKPIAQVEAISDYEVLTDGVFDLRGLTWKPQAAIFVATPHGADGVLSLSHHGQVIPVDRAVRSSADRSVWIPPGFEMIREQREWGSGFHEHIAVAGHRVAHMVRSTLQGDSADFPADARLIKTRRAGPLAGEELVYTTREQPDVEVRASYQFWGSTNDVPDFRTVHVPEGGALFLFEAYFAGSYQGRIEIVTGSRSDLGSLSWTPKLAAFAAAPAGPDGILAYQPALRVFAPGTNALPADVSVWFPKGYRVSDPIAPAYLRYISGQPDGSPVGLSLSDVIVERFAGILSSGEGYGLTIERTQSELRGAGDELRFGGELLRPDRWYHLAQTWDSETEILQWYLNGRPVKQAKLSKAVLGSVDSWVLGRSFRGAIAQVRVWNSARTLEQIRDDRYPTTTPAAAPALDLFAQGFDAWQAPSDAVVVSADLPAAPADSVLVKRMQQQVEAENARNVQIAHQHATAQRILAHKQAQRKLALAREQARRDIHIQGIKQLGFVRAQGLILTEMKAGQIPTEPQYFANARITDLAMDPMGRYFISLDGSSWSIHNVIRSPFSPAYQPVTPELENPPQALALDHSGNHFQARQAGKVLLGIYWIESNGVIWRTWIDPETNTPGEPQALFGFPTPLGRSGYWDMALDSERQILYWTNGWELYASDVSVHFPYEFHILLPHVASPFPLAVAVTPDGALLWLDAEDEVVRMRPPAGGGVTDFQYMDFQRTAEKETFILGTRADPGQPALEWQKVGTKDLTPRSVRLIPRASWIVMADLVWERTDLDQPPDMIRVYTMEMKWGDLQFTLLFVLEPDRASPETALPDFGFWRPEDDERYGVIERVREFQPAPDRRIKSGHKHQVLWVCEQRELEVHVTIYVDHDEVASLVWRDIRPLPQGWGYVDPSPEVSCGFPDQTLLNGQINRLRAWSSFTPAGAWPEIMSAEESEAKTLYPAARPARGLAVSRLADKNGSGKEAAFLYWVASVRRTAETPVLDTPGRYIDLYHDPRHPHWGQHVAMVAVSGFTGVQWTDATDGSPTKMLAFGAAKNPDPSTTDQDAQPPDADDVLTFEPIRLDLRHGFTVSADLVWRRVESDPQTAICFYELATFEDEDRIACLIGPDSPDGQSGIPILHLRWDGQVVTGEFQIVSNRRLRSNEQQRVTWMLDRHGVVSTFIEGEKVVEAKISLPKGVRVFEGHALGAPNAAQTHEMIEGALLQRDDARQVFAAFQGRIVRFGAWNCAAPQAAQGWEHTPGPDPTWARSLVTVESKRRYLHAGRLDGQEPPLTLFPIELDGGLNIETALDQAHAELTLAHAQKAAAEEQAAQLKAAALQDAHARLDAAAQDLTATQTKAAADMAAAQAQADRDKAAARDRMSDADAQAERDRVQGKQDADQYKADKKKTAEDTETRAAADNRARVADANQRRADAQRKLDERR